MENGTKKIGGMNRREFLKYAGATGAALSFSGVPYIARSAPKEIIFASVNSFTGLATAYHTAPQVGQDLALEDLIKRGGIKSLGGAILKEVKYDTESNVEVAANATERACSSGAVAILGSTQSSVCLRLTSVAEKYKVPVIVPESLSDEITERGYKYIFRPQAAASKLSDNILEGIAWLKDNKTGKKVKTLVHLHEETGYGRSMDDGFKAGAKKIGLEIVSSFPFPLKTTDFSNYVAKIKAVNPDFILNTGYPPDQIMFIRALKEANYMPMGVHVGASAEIKEWQAGIGKDGEYIFGYGYAPGTAPAMPRQLKKEYEDLNERANKAAKKDLNGLWALGYCCQSVLIDALERAGSTERKAIRDALAKTDIKPYEKGNYYPWGVKFAESGQNILSRMYTGQVRKGTFLLVQPDTPEIKEIDVVFPIPPWDKR
jgi:branched-chain amino acid transport system substrate-binding protein